MTTAQISRTIKDRRIATVRLGGCDIDGVYRAKRLPAEAFLRSIEQGFPQSEALFGLDIAGVPIEGLEVTGWQTGFPDLQMKPDLSTFSVIPWEDGAASVVADFTGPDGRPFEVSPREVLRRVVAEARKLGYVPQAVARMDMRLQRETLVTPREKPWDEVPAPVSGPPPLLTPAKVSGEEFLSAKIRQAMDAYGIPVESMGRGARAGIFEIGLRAVDQLTAADRALLLKHGIKEICQQEGWSALFMAKVADGEPGHAGHIEQTLWDGRGSKNLFAAESKKEKGPPISELMRHFLAGVLSTLREFFVLYAPNVNSYKRYVRGSFAPTTVTWGVDNRTCALRVVATPGNPQATRIENRVPGSDVNPYLGLAAMLAGGLHGVREKLEPPPATSGSAYDAPENTAPPLPRALPEAVELFEKSELAKKAFGEAFVRHYSRTRRWEWEQFSRVVSPWERARYGEVV